MSVYSQGGKRALDVLAAAALLLVFLPVLAGTGLIVALKLGLPVLFRQRRPGIRGRSFTIFKFRTMSLEHDAGGVLQPDARRLRPFGRWLRATSLDELPELFNVLRGDMSLVGPRPLLTEYLPRYSRGQARRHEVRPGITGWAQVHGRNELSWDDKLEMDVWYVDNVGILLDLGILCRTMVDVVRRRGISADGHATMPEFAGSDDEQH